MISLADVTPETHLCPVAIANHAAGSIPLDKLAKLLLMVLIIADSIRGAASGQSEYLRKRGRLYTY